MANEIVISSNESDFKTMIFKLMGRGLSTSVRKYGSFTIKYDDICDLIDRLHQRVETQNDCAMSDFHAEFTFSDGSIDRVPSLEAFRVYRSINRNICIKANLKFAFIVNFKSRGNEKQNIDVVIEAIDEKNKIFLYQHSQDAKLISGYAEIDIEYTDIIWANDIKNIFNEYIKTHLFEHKYRKMLKPYFATVNFSGFIFPISMVLYLLYHLTRLSDPWNIKIIERIESNSSGFLQSISDKIDVLILNENNQVTLVGISSPFLFVVSLISLWIISSYIIRNVPKSGIILSEEAEKRRKYENDRVKNGNKLAILGIIASISSTIISPFIESIFR